MITRRVPVKGSRVKREKRKGVGFYRVLSISERMGIGLRRSLNLVSEE